MPLQRDLISLAGVLYLLIIIILSLTGSGYVQISQRKHGSLVVYRYC